MIIYFDKHRQFSFYSNLTNTNNNKNTPSSLLPSLQTCISYRPLSQETHIIHRPPHHHTAGPPGLHTPAQDHPGLHTPLQDHHRTTRTTTPKHTQLQPPHHQDHTAPGDNLCLHTNTPPGPRLQPPHYQDYHKTPPRPHCAMRQTMYYFVVQ